MTSTVSSVTLNSCIKADHTYAERQPLVPLLALRKTRVQWFYIIDVNGERPEELKRSPYRDIKESEIHLPATAESLTRIQRAFDLCPIPCRFANLEIRYDVDNCKERGDNKKDEKVNPGKAKKIDIIVFSISTAIKPKQTSA